MKLHKNPKMYSIVVCLPEKVACRQLTVIQHFQRKGCPELGSLSKISMLENGYLA
jgi:hypothetical protein